MKKHLFILLLFLPFFGSAQNASKPAFSRFQIGTGFSPDFAYRMLRSNQNRFLLEARENTEEPKFGYTVGIGAQFNVNQWLGITAGLMYADRGYQTKKTALVPFEPDPELPDAIRNRYHFNYMDLPVMIRLRLPLGSRAIALSAGAATNVLVQQTVTTIQYSGDDRNVERESHAFSETSYNRINLSPIMSLGIEQNLGPFLQLRFEPTIRFNLLSISSFTPVSEHLWSAGLNIGLWFSA